jgi:hypothetical protein
MPAEKSVDEEALKEEGVIDVDEKAEAFASAQAVSYFGADFDVQGLVRRLDSGDIVIPSFDPATETGSALAGFQRRFVWRKYQMDRFVESLLLGYPVPGIFLVQQGDRKLLVLDGQQRLRTLQKFYKGVIDKDTVFKLESVSKELVGLTYADLAPEQRRSLDNTFIHATIVKYDPELKGDESVYQVFERLNTGGTNLYPHEIRIALYNGKLASYIRELNLNKDWRMLYGDPSDRLKDQELILRFIALFHDEAKYARPLKAFLNNFMRDHRQLEKLDAKAMQKLFGETCRLINAGIGKKAFRTKNAVNAALVDSVLVGVASRLKKGPVRDAKTLEPGFARLMDDSDFQSAIGRATADEDRVATRLKLAKKAFAASE